MIGYILTGHGHFSTGLKSAVDMIAGPQDNFEAVPFEEEKAGEYAGTIKAAIEAMREKCDGVLVFVDLVGGTPFNQSMMVSASVDNVQIVAGTNLPMLIDLMMARTPESQLSDLVAEAVEVGKEGVTHLELSNAATDDEDDE
ncbi:MAG TPA: PTS sugar transporter subunit IIA [Candidatus Olsenella pullicola]|nr:PTS sugar transporter subunit IIA [Candidatus Olsenella pullicola]